jgi:formate hydrogenlyase subunit 6/NADH:ubiquinone oxidoreductase subunit I
VNTYATEARSALYQSLAEAFSEPPTWLVHAGNRWSVYHAALQVAQEEDNQELHRAALALSLIPAGGLQQRRKHYHRLISSIDHPNLCFHESLARHERLGGMLTIAVWTAYRAVGLQVNEEISPDHLSVELTFMSYMIQQQLTAPDDARHWRKARRLFVKRHVGQWLPAVGDALFASNDPIYAPLGQILAIAIRTESPKNKPKQTRTNYHLPVMTQSDICNLCNFCVQVCPTHALVIRENTEWTMLTVDDINCISCKKCVAICPTHALQLKNTPPTTETRSLNSSPRCHCVRCGNPTVSQAEIDAISQQIGNPEWLDYCSDCRSML